MNGPCCFLPTTSTLCSVAALLLCDNPVPSPLHTGFLRFLSFQWVQTLVLLCIFLADGPLSKDGVVVSLDYFLRLGLHPTHYRCRWITFMRSAWLKMEGPLGVAGSRVDVTEGQQGQRRRFRETEESKLDLKERDQKMLFFHLGRFQNGSTSFSEV